MTLTFDSIFYSGAITCFEYPSANRTLLLQERTGHLRAQPVETHVNPNCFSSSLFFCFEFSSGLPLYTISQTPVPGFPFSVPGTSNTQSRIHFELSLSERKICIIGLQNLCYNVLYSSVFRFATVFDQGENERKKLERCSIWKWQVHVCSIYLAFVWCLLLFMCKRFYLTTCNRMSLRVIGLRLNLRL